MKNYLSVFLCNSVCNSESCFNKTSNICFWFSIIACSFFSFSFLSIIYFQTNIPKNKMMLVITKYNVSACVKFSIASFLNPKINPSHISAVVTPLNISPIVYSLFVSTSNINKKGGLL